MEEWKDIQAYDGIYQVSSYGRVKRIFYKTNKSNTILKPAKDCCGYMRCVLCKDGIGKTHKVHRLVANTFIRNPENKPEVNHINGVKTDNRVENLEWVTRIGNMQHLSKVIGKKGTLKGVFSQNHPRSKKVSQYANGVLVKDFNSAHDAHSETGINHANINSCCRGKRATAGGYVWKYKI